MVAEVKSEFMLEGFEDSPEDYDFTVQPLSAHEERLYPIFVASEQGLDCLLYTSPSPRDLSTSRMPSSA